MSVESSVAYQNKDIAMKYLEEHLENKTFAVYGVDVPKIVKVLPTNLPIIEANELRMDNLFLLEDGSVALVDYESTYVDENKIKYLNYIVRVLKRIMSQNHQFVKIRMVVIYTADIERNQTRARLDAGCLQFQLEEAFLRELDSASIEERIRKKIEREETLTPEEQMEFIVLPLTKKGGKAKQSCIRRCFEMVKAIKAEKEQIFLLSGMLVFADKVIKNEDSKEMRCWIMMTKIGRMFEEEKLEYAREQVRAKLKESNKAVARKLFKRGNTLEDVSDIATDLTLDELFELEAEVKKEKK